MAEHSKHINYTFEDIQRYLNGGMSAAEMHDLEKAALQDPFLADAIEGYTEADLTITQKHLNEINARVTGKKERSKIVSINNTTRWLNVAAILIIVTGISVFSFYFLINPGKKQQVAQVKKESSPDQNSKDSVVGSTGGLSRQTDTIITIAQNKKSQPPVLRAPSKKENANSLASSGKSVQADKAKVTTMAASPAIQQNETASTSLANGDVDAKKNDSVQQSLRSKTSGISVASNIFSGKVIDENNKPVPGAVIESADKKTAAITDLNGNFNFQRNDSLLKVTASNIGYENKAMTLGSRQDNVIMLKVDNASLNEVPVVGYNASKKTKAINQTAMPVVGWQNFNTYVMSQLNKDTTADAITNPDDLVEMEFLIDKAGNPYNIKITKPLDEQRNTKAIEILKSGPKWTTTSKSKKVMLTISF